MLLRSQDREVEKSPIERDSSVIRQNNWLPKASIHLCRRNRRVTARASIAGPPRSRSDHSRSAGYTVI